MELSILCGINVYLLLFDPNNKRFVKYSSHEDFKEKLEESTASACESISNNEYYTYLDLMMKKESSKNRTHYFIFKKKNKKRYKKPKIENKILLKKKKKLTTIENPKTGYPSRPDIGEKIYNNGEDDSDEKGLEAEGERIGEREGEEIKIGEEYEEVKEVQSVSQKENFSLKFHETLKKNYGSHLKISIPIQNQFLNKMSELNQELIPKNSENISTLPFNFNNDKSNSIFFSPHNKSESLENDHQAYSGLLINSHYHPLFSANKQSPKIEGSSTFFNNNNNNNIRGSFDFSFNDLTAFNHLNSIPMSEFNNPLSNLSLRADMNSENNFPLYKIDKNDFPPQAHSLFKEAPVQIKLHQIHE